MKCSYYETIYIPFRRIIELARNFTFISLGFYYMKNYKKKTIVNKLCIFSVIKIN